MLAKTYLFEGDECYVGTETPVWPSRFREIKREMRDGIRAPLQDLKDDTEVVHLLERLDKLERETQPGVDARDKDFAASEALHLASALVDFVAGWAIDHEMGKVRLGLSSIPVPPEKGKPSREYEERRAQVDNHELERIGALKEPLDLVSARRFTNNLLRAMGTSLRIPEEIIEAIEALDYGEILPILQKASTTKRTGLVAYRARLSAIAFIDYENEKGILKEVSREKVEEAFAVTRDAVKDWKAELQVALGTFEVNDVLEDARAFGRDYVDHIKHTKEEHRWVLDYFESAYGMPALLLAAKRYKARSKAVDSKSQKKPR